MTKHINWKYTQEIYFLRAKSILHSIHETGKRCTYQEQILMFATPQTPPIPPPPPPPDVYLLSRGRQWEWNFMQVDWITSHFRIGALEGDPISQRLLKINVCLTCAKWWVHDNELLMLHATPIWSTYDGWGKTRPQHKLKVIVSFKKSVSIGILVIFHTCVLTLFISQILVT